MSARSKPRPRKKAANEPREGAPRPKRAAPGKAARGPSPQSRPRQPAPPLAARRRPLEALGWLGVAASIGLALVAIQLVARDRATNATFAALWAADALAAGAIVLGFRDTRLAGLGRWWIAPLLAAFVATPSRPQSFDTYGTRYLAVSLAERGDFDLDEWPEQLEIVKPAYWVHRHEGHLYNAYPPGASLFAAPLWPLFRLAGFHAKAAPVYALAKTAAAFAVALAAAVLQAALRRHGLARAAAPVAFGFALASGNLALASQDLWQHGPAELGLAIAVWALAERGPRDAAWLGFGLGFAALMRPMLLSVAGVTALVWLARHRDRRSLVLLAAGLAAPLLVGAACNLAVFGTLVGGYSRELRGSIWQGNPLVALAGNAVSPSRGVLVFSPWLAALVPGVVLAVRRAPGLAATLLAPVAVFFVIVGMRVEWWAGHGYGPRYPLDVLPYLAFLTALAVDAALGAAPRAALALLAPLLTWGVLAQLPAFLGEEGRRWSGSPNVDQYPARLWSWSDGQLWSGWNEWLGIARDRYVVGRMHRVVGEVAPDARFGDEPFVACAPPGESGRGYLAFGPGHRFGAGAWQASFRLAVDRAPQAGECAGAEPAAVVDVVSQGGVPVWARRAVPACAVGPETVKLAFVLEHAQPLELRVETSGSARVCASRIDVARAAGR
ncbi:MAG: hypothetical protein IPK07_27645 [Deltaproteobacteria bacterium]|nr:hypothetical protein [Deltaproteobacteria bacterium]